MIKIVDQTKEIINLTKVNSVKLEEIETISETELYIRELMRRVER
jgi:hypothetical protein